MEILKYLQDFPESQLSTYAPSGEPIRYSYPTIRSSVMRLANFLSYLGVAKRSRVGVIGPNNFHWLLADLALIHLDAVSVCPPHEKLSSDGLAQLARSYSVGMILVSDKATMSRLREVNGSVLVEDILSGNAGVAVEPPPAVETDTDVFTIAFSSGTAGSIKSLLVTKSGIDNTIRISSCMWKLDRGDNILIALPFSSMQNRTLAYTAIQNGCCFSVVPPHRLVSAYRDLKPSILVGPPAFYKYLTDRWAAMPLHHRASIRAVTMILCRSLPRRLAEPLKVRACPAIFGYFGPRMRLMIVGSAPCPGHVLQTYRRLGLPLYQVYGVTEFGWISFNLPGDCSIESVGRPIPGVGVNIGDDGEIVVSGAHPQALGYLEAPAGHADRTFVRPGTIVTGDCGHLDRDGFLYLDGRTKNVIVTRAGAKVSAESVEHEIEELKAVDAAVLMQLGKTQAVTVVVKCDDGQALREQSRIRGAILDVLARNGLDASDAVIAIETNHADWNSMMTRNFKLDRRVIASRYGGDNR